MKKTLTFVGCLILTTFLSHAERFAGGDISLLPEYEAAGAKYKTNDGTEIPDLLPWLREQGMNAMRVRLFVNPADHKSKYPSEYDPNACQDLEYITPLCQDIVDNGFDLMLDFHYSDTWADPAKQWIPESWRGLSDEQLYEKIFDYTKETLLSLKEAGVTPSFIQPGNEISYGMLWGMEDDPSSSLKKTFMGSDSNWNRLGQLLSQAIKACREVCPDAKIVLHTERVAQPDVLKNFYDRMAGLDVDYDIIGLSYYPYFHGDLTVLDTALSTLQNNFPGKNIMIVETGYSYKWEVPGTTYDFSKKWAYSEAGQNAYAKDLVSTLEKYENADGLFWWWMEYNAFGTSLSGWYNAPLFNSLDGRATPALTTICSFATPSSVGQLPSSSFPQEPTPVFDLLGRPVKDTSTPGLYISPSGKKLMLKRM